MGQGALNGRTPRGVLARAEESLVVPPPPPHHPFPAFLSPSLSLRQGVAQLHDLAPGEERREFPGPAVPGSGGEVLGSHVRIEEGGCQAVPRLGCREGRRKGWPGWRGVPLPPREKKVPPASRDWLPWSALCCPPPALQRHAHLVLDPKAFPASAGACSPGHPLGTSQSPSSV